MTQTEFDQLPLLLRYAQVVAVLEGMNRRAFMESIADGSLCRWPSGGPWRMRYYLKADVAAMAGLRMQKPVLPQLNTWMSRGQLLRLLGLGDHYYRQTVRAGLLPCDHEARPPWRLRLRVAELVAWQRGSTRIDAAKTLTLHEHA